MEILSWGKIFKSPLLSSCCLFLYQAFLVEWGMYVCFKEITELQPTVSETSTQFLGGVSNFHH